MLISTYINLGSTQSGKIEIRDTGESYKVIYYNDVYKNSPFECPTSFSKDFSVREIVRSGEIAKFLSRFCVYVAVSE